MLSRKGISAREAKSKIERSLMIVQRMNLKTKLFVEVHRVGGEIPKIESITLCFPREIDQFRIC